MSSSKGTSSIAPILLLIVGLIVGGGGGYLYMSNTYEPLIYDYENQIADYSSEISILSNEKKELESEKTNLEAQVVSIDRDNADLESEITSLESEILSFHSQVSKLQTEKSSLESQVSTLQTTLSQKNSQISSLQAEINDQESELSSISEIVVTQHYRWEYSPSWYSSSEWTWDLPISLGTYFNYHFKERPESWNDWVDIVNDPDDDYYISSMVQHINSAAYSKGFTESQKVDFVIAFVQSLPYTVDSVTTDWNEYPRYPLETLFDRGGDCEDTSILVAALLDRMGYDVCLLILSHADHCAVGVSLDGAYGSYYNHDGKKYFYLETTGEGWEIGDIPSSISDTRAYIYPITS